MQLSGEEDCWNQYTKRKEIHDGFEMNNVEEESECLEDGPTDRGHVYDEWV